MAIDMMVVLVPNQPVYFPGQTVKGYVRVDVQSNTSCRGLEVRLKGVSRVKWSERRGKTTRHYSNYEEYSRLASVLWRGAEHGGRIGPGRLRYPFAFELPLDIPSSFESDTGRVRYQVKAVADVPWAMDQEVKVLFSVNQLYDLNSDPRASIPLRQTDEKNVCFCCLADGSISVSVSASRSGYVAGESMLINARVVNRTWSSVQYTEAKIVQVIKYIATNKTKTEQRTVQRIYRPQIAPGGTDEWSNVPLPVPAVPASHLKYCNIIVIHYMLVFQAKLGTCRSAKVECPLVVGTVPLRNTYVQRPPLPRVGGSSSTVEVGGTSVVAGSEGDPPRPSAPPPVPPHSPNWAPGGAPGAPEEQGGDEPPPYTNDFMPDSCADIPPPSYESCVFSSEVNRALGARRSGRDEDDLSGFAPQYVMYRSLSQEPGNT